MAKNEQNIKMFIQKLQDENKEFKVTTAQMKSQDEEQQELKQKVEVQETIKRKWAKTLLFYKQQQKALGSQVEELTKEKKEKENVLTYLELVNLKNAYLLNSKELKRNITKVEKEKLAKEKEYQKNL